MKKLSSLKPYKSYLPRQLAFYTKGYSHYKTCFYAIRAKNEPKSPSDLIDFNFLLEEYVKFGQTLSSQRLLQYDNLSPARVNGSCWTLSMLKTNYKALRSAMSILHKLPNWVEQRENAATRRYLWLWSLCNRMCNWALHWQ